MLKLFTLNPQQRIAVEMIRGPVLILAGAGTGKTRVLTYRIAWMMEKGISPDQILAVTFTNKAAREMQSRVTRLLGKQRSTKTEKKGRLTVCTFHSLCVRILRNHIHHLGFKPNFVIYNQSDQLGIVRKILSRSSSGKEKPDPVAALNLISQLKNGLGRGESKENNSPAARWLDLYQSTLKSCNAVDFDDLILLTLELFKRFSGTLETCRKKYQFIMVDEYQDTNAAQFQLIHLLSQTHRNLCVVGDDDQSIYGWRGAEVANLQDLERHYPEVKIIKLEHNYRSTNVILNAANALIRNNSRRRAKRLWSDRGEGSKIVLQVFDSEEDEADKIVEQIEFARLAKRTPWSQQAILFRTNVQSRPLETALRRESIRYHLVGGQSFFDRREIQDFLAYLKVMLNPHDDQSLLRIANTPPRGLSTTTMERLLAASQTAGSSVFSAMSSPANPENMKPQARKKIDAFVALIHQTRSRLEESELQTPFKLATWAEIFLSQIGFFAEVRRAEKTPQAADLRERNVKDLIGAMDDRLVSESRPIIRLRDFLDATALDQEWQEENRQPQDAVTLITLHSCKGLEFPHVYIVGLESGLLPHSRSIAEDTLEEERRLFYVGITRAMIFLSLSHCQARKKYGQSVPCHPSPFLSEIPEELVTDSDALGGEPITPSDGKGLFDRMRQVTQ